MEANDCPNKPEPEFCPNQNDICCYGSKTKLKIFFNGRFANFLFSVRLSETKCRNRGGECVSTCPDFLTDTRALDCPAGERCCIFVH